ncbi:LytTR family transcriptional regulator DNA-binding domain-containing protein [Saccharicrinis aurantiacus]|uniref:LytTR family transcriptional regulator DNA-binding domain-containing protein n=1 Tax=Saccharicrinis aurantiacus TaxID=1849719 RepID=UPI002491CD42|nr:LytTR family transcriptional regulator DNA-binding domain-containing protein [Saccharicrinis aurantiacus]
MLGSINKALISGKDFYHYVTIADILYCKSKGSNTAFCVQDYGFINVSVDIQTVSEKLRVKGFIKPHNLYLVNQAFIQSISRKKHTDIQLKGGATIPVSEELKTELINSLEQSLGLRIP